ncbi:hydantoinase/oxoprolinase N-terminal domain-containing protein [Vibrio gazogenes]|uniref:N-methylhydantoinase A/oxoprolinase/acetone carboxylase, beta subunit n=1 Tax=Vibrio gazogenes DSM 21264 = NBRC 103151 TaxID=1123492 RepID=A0A1M5DU77_VIBGA|nr:hydantoinase/oxoprolinase family protein [Vibrio gazogenes]USP14873.1 hydantoinase/oxoprolinase family protein [Vibrio gazogenes]SHF70485.1 N-methylhydantoinase A/oxoprolinase/acetone carboxylase, beta subunit [Vibrio gazogenes DSM 21264] [Vibrio gazogenes DSM 21264 = NBRC 103151]
MTTCYRIGIDVGGTNTDAVLMNYNEVVVTTKQPTTEDVTTGIEKALRIILETSGVACADILGVMIGTTHFTNAVVERKHLTKTAVIRLCLPATLSVPPFAGWPDDIKSLIDAGRYMVKGGYEFDGRKINPLDEVHIKEIALELKNKGVTSAIVNSVFSPVNDDSEKRVAEIFAELYPECRVVLSNQVGRIGLLERENAAILNASLLALSEKTVDAFANALKVCGLHCPFFITQNDGTLMNAEFVKRFPVLTFASGPTNSMRGAVFLSGEQDAIVVDIGGTTTDVGLVQQGFPRQASSSVDVGGVRTNFRMPDMVSVGLGGGSCVNFNLGIIDKKIEVGPHSVGYRITEEALVFGGTQTTATDIAVASGRVQVGDVSKVTDIDESLVALSLEEIDRIMLNVVEKNRLSSAQIPVIVVGGGSIIAPDEIGGLKAIKPNHFSVANAVGAAIAQVSGEADKIYSLTNLTRQEAIDDAVNVAIERAVAAGASAQSIQVIDQEDVPLAYLPGNATRIRVKVVGDLEFNHD